jgi:ketosteroid isomerase-like protein
MTEDIVVIHGNGRMVEGREAVLADFTQSFGSLTVKQTVEFEETVVAADWAFDRATVHSTISAGEGGIPKHFQSRTITILRREPSQTWRVARTIGVVVQPQP